MIFKSEVSDLILQIEKDPFNSSKNLFQKLLLSIQQSLLDFEPKRNLLKQKSISLKKYPITDKYAPSFDPLTESEELLEHWYTYGFVVGENICYEQDSLNAIDKIHSIINSFNLNDSSSYIKDPSGTPILSRGFFELYHDNCLAQIRQNIRLYLYHCLLWNTPYLWTSFDRVGLKPPIGESSLGLSLHVDQNPLVHPQFTTIQGVLALDDCPIERGTFSVVPGSISLFQEYSQLIKPGYKGEFVSLDDPFLLELFLSYQQLIPIKKNTIVSWDSRTTHSNSSNVSNINRYVFYVSTGIAQEHQQDLIDIRQNSFLTGLGNNSRDAFLHASKKPRFTDTSFINSIRDKELLHPLGQCLYSLKYYKDLQ